jgi:O-antigen/teichoic acid export membrane protein
MTLGDKTVLNILAKSSEAFLLLISSIIMVRAFPKTEYGTFLQIVLISSTAIMFTFFGLPESIYYFFRQTANQRHFVIRNVLFSMFMGLIVAIIVFCLKNELAHWLNNPLLLKFGWVAPLLILLRTPSRLREIILIAHGSLIVNSATTLLCNLLFYGPLIIAALFMVSLETLLKVMILVSGIELCLYFGLMSWVAFHVQTIDLSRDLQKKEISFKEQFKYAFPIGVSYYIWIIGRQLDQYIVSAFFTPRDFAVYSRGAMKVPFLSSIRYTTDDIMMPEYVSAFRAGDIKAMLSQFHRCLEKVAKINFPAFALLFAIAPSIVTLLYTKEYLEAASILRVYLCFLVTELTGYYVIFNATGKTFYSMYVNIISVLTNIIFSLGLVSIMGPIGAAMATVISQVIMIFICLFQFCKILGVSFGKIFPWKHLSQLFFVSLAASIPVYCIEYVFRLKGGHLFLVLLVDSVVYCYCCVFLMMRIGLIYQDDMELLKKWLRFDVERFLQKIMLLS